MRSLLAALSVVIIVGATIPYMIDIAKHRSRPARSARIMLLLLIAMTLVQQHSLGSGWSLSITAAETLASLMLLLLSLKHGVGGLHRLDKICYILLVVDLLVWLTTKNTLLALHLSIVADTVAFWPTLHKTWNDPDSETKIFFWAGVIAPLFSIMAEAHPSYRTLVFPAYLSLANAAEVILIYGLHRKRKAR